MITKSAYSEWLLSQPTLINRVTLLCCINSLQSLLADFSVIFYGGVMWLAVYIFMPLDKQSLTDHPIINLLHLQSKFRCLRDGLTFDAYQSLVAFTLPASSTCPLFSHFVSPAYFHMVFQFLFSYHMTKMGCLAFRYFTYESSCCVSFSSFFISLQSIQKYNVVFF